jgi:hypothetical protein
MFILNFDSRLIFDSAFLIWKTELSFSWLYNDISLRERDDRGWSGEGLRSSLVNYC